MHFARPRAALIAAACLALLQATAVVGLPKSSDSGVEYVKACDSGPDDVTNQCINRIPEDVGIDSGNHACAYHEAEVKCLGLCGNTVTWKTSYKNALKRYRLVCARFIEERLAEKDEDEDANGGDDSSTRKKSAAASDDSSNKSDGDSKADDGGDSSDPPPKAKKQKPSASNASSDKKDDKKAAVQSKKENAQSSAPSSQKAKSSAAAKPSPSETDSAHAKSASPSSKAQSAKDKGSTDDINDLINNISSALDSPQAKEKPRQAKNGGNAKPGSAEGDKDKRVKAMLPTMDPEIAGAPCSAHTGTVFNSILVLCATFAYAFL
ncbi:hypothetical protein IWW48_001806 [Coemansia sp. RSA 1200]|nr:hypothetical protein IWW48_001806 [Coemansia sp. RSA 1200]